MDDSGAASPDQDDKQDGEKMEKHKKKGNKATKPKFEPKGNYIFSVLCHLRMTTYSKENRGPTLICFKTFFYLPLLQK